MSDSVGFSWIRIITPLISHFEHGHFTLAQTLESLKIGEALNSSKYPTPGKCKFELSTRSWVECLNLHF